jgi:hypothetical protein
MSGDVMSGYLSTRTTLCLLAGIGALSGGAAGAAIVGKLATDGSVGAAVARDEPAAPSLTRAAQVAATAAQSPSRLPTPWSAAEVDAVRAGGARHQTARAQAPLPSAMRPTRAGAAPVSAPASGDANAVTQTTARPARPAPVTAAPQASAPQTAAPQTSAPARPPAQKPVRSPAPQRAPEPSPAVSRPSPEPAPARSSPKPDPTGAFDDSG